MFDILPINPEYIQIEPCSYSNKVFKYNRKRFLVLGSVYSGYLLVTRLNLFGFKQESYLVSSVLVSDSMY